MGLLAHSARPRAGGRRGGIDFPARQPIIVLATVLYHLGEVQ